MDKIDNKILQLLQQNGELSTAEIAAAVGLSTTPCWRRIQRMEQEGIIENRVVLLNRQKLNLGIDVFVAVKTSQHNLEWLSEFSAEV
ncbi:MAG: Lrp/AsnC family transcriptional regulator, partial [Gammaproteobacteria bacterium]|nr:Lrp/AsnC family transcriptional regulator [Gammaproteobacteria bacterium]